MSEKHCKTCGAPAVIAVRISLNSGPWQTEAILLACVNCRERIVRPVWAEQAS